MSIRDWIVATFWPEHELQRQVERQETHIADWRRAALAGVDEVNRARDTIAALRDGLAARDTEIEQLRHDIAARDTEIARLRGGVEALVASVGRLNSGSRER